MGDRWLGRVRLTASGTRDGRCAPARLGPVVVVSTLMYCSRDRGCIVAFRETRPVTFTRCGYAAICIPRIPTMTSIFRPLSGAAANKENSTPPSCSQLEPTNIGHLPTRVLTIRLGTVTSTHLGLCHQFPSRTKKRMQATSVADTGMTNPLRLIPLLFTPTPALS